MNIQQMIKHNPLSLLGVLGLTLFASPVTAQVFDLGPSDPAFFDTVVNLPADSNIGDDASVGGGDLLIQLNVDDGGNVGSNFESNNRSEVNISGGSIGENFEANGGSEVNLNGGLIGRNFNANINSTINISRGSLSDFANANSGSTVNISGGTVGFGFEAFDGSVVTISGGTIGRGFNDASFGSEVELIGGEFRGRGGVPFSGATVVSFSSNSILTGTLSDGSTFIFSGEEGDDLANVRLTSVELPELDLSPIVVSTPNPNLPSGLRPGQTLRLVEGGQLGFNFEVASATLDIEGGTLGDFASAANSTVNISGGSVGNFFSALSGSEVNISGGSVGNGFQVNGGSVVNISGGNIGGSFGRSAFSEFNVFGSNFAIDGEPLASLANGGTMRISQRDVTLSGLLADGSEFSFDLDSSQFRFDAVVRVTVGERVFAQDVTHVPLFTFDGDSADDSFGTSVSGAGDVNGDGFDDLIVGAPNDDNNGEDSGSARVFSGADGSILYNFLGDSTNDGFGRSVSGAGDVNGDGFADLIVSARQGTNNAARVFSGADGSTLYNIVGFGTGLSLSVSGAGDINGDGNADLIVGNDGDSSNGLLSGNARVISGADGTDLYNFDGESAGDQFGQSVSGAGDVNRDGFDDLIVGAPGENDGSARVLSGADGSVIHRFQNSPSFSGLPDLFGVSVSGAGDVNGDGFADLIVGEPTPTLYNGDPNDGFAFVYSGFDGRAIFGLSLGSVDREAGFSVGDRFGSSVSGAGDVNGDGFADVIVGAPGDRVGLFENQNYSTVTGSVEVTSGFNGSRIATWIADSAGDQFGTSVSDVGDVNGDGIGDYIVGAPNGGANDGGYARLFVSQIAGSVILGDVDQNGVVDFADIPAFIAVLQAGMFLPEADVNQDGEVTFADIPAFIEILQAG